MINFSGTSLHKPGKGVWFMSLQVWGGDSSFVGGCTRQEDRFVNEFYSLLHGWKRQVWNRGVHNKHSTCNIRCVPKLTIVFSLNPITFPYKTSPSTLSLPLYLLSIPSRPPPPPGTPHSLFFFFLHPPPPLYPVLPHNSIIIFSLSIQSFSSLSPTPSSSQPNSSTLLALQPNHFSPFEYSSHSTLLMYPLFYPLHYSFQSTTSPSTPPLPYQYCTSSLWL